MKSWVTGMLASRWGERGQALVLFAGGLALFLGLAGLAIDIGHTAAVKSDLQKDADAAALAGAQDLPTYGNALSTADSYLMKNGYKSCPGCIEITASSGSTNDTIRVTTEKTVDFMFLKFVGVSSMTPKASAKVVMKSYQGGTGIMPLGLLASGLQQGKVHNNCYQGMDASGMPTFDQNIPCTLHGGASNCPPGQQCTGGDFGELALDGPGANDYQNALVNGSKKVYKTGDLVDTQTGNQVGPTTKGLQDHLAKPQPPGCGTGAKEDVLITNPDGTSTIKPGCETSPNIWIIPVVNQFNNPAKSTILGFAFMYVTAVKSKGGHTELTGQFVTFVTELPNGIYGANGSKGSTILKLVE